MEERKGTVFDTKIKPLLVYIGTIGAVLMSIAYIITVFVLIYGFKVDKVLHTTIFSLVNAGVGFVVMQFLKVQGISFAKEIPDNKALIEKYYGTKTKDKKIHSINHYWFTSVVKDLFIKCLTIAITTFGVIYLVLEGNKDYKLILLAIINLIMFISFGLLALVKSYEYYNNEHVKYMKEKIDEAKKDDIIQRERTALQVETRRVESEDKARTEEIEEVPEVVSLPYCISLQMDDIKHTGL